MHYEHMYENTTWQNEKGWGRTPNFSTIYIYIYIYICLCTYTYIYIHILLLTITIIIVITHDYYHIIIVTVYTYIIILLHIVCVHMYAYIYIYIHITMCILNIYTCIIYICMKTQLGRTRRDTGVRPISLLTLWVSEGLTQA